MIVDHITIENFQRFGAPVRLALGPLTFLYGPNSSGKSAVSDAMRLLHEIVFEPPGSVLPLVQRWSRRDSGDSTAYLPIKLAIEARDTWSDGDDFEDYFSGLEPVERGRRTRETRWVPEIEYTIKIIVELSCKLGDEYDHEIIFLFDLYIDGYHLIEYRTDESTRDGEGTVKIWPTGPLAQYLSEFTGPDTDESGNAVIHETGTLFGGEDFFSRFSNAELERKLNWCLGVLLKRIWQPGRDAPFNLFTVSGDRGIPTPQHCEVKTRLTDQRVQVVNGEHPWFIGRLAKACAESYLLEVPGVDEFGFIGNPVAVVEPGREQGTVQLFARRGKAQIERVNYALGDLFQSNGYQIVFDAKEIRRAAKLSKPIPQKDRIAESWDIRIRLIDAHGNALEFDDVGSGISYVLPVLVALSEGGSFIHQPELHLHPAMQAQLADLFVERVSGDDQARHILETHSEYLLLRVLRRIRETHMGRLDQSERKITPDDVMIYYFDPQLDGTTDVTEIPVNEFGDFLKPWPKGFFEERGKDLFDD